jgi:hypothetical protein
MLKSPFWLRYVTDTTETDGGAKSQPDQTAGSDAGTPSTGAETDQPKDQQPPPLGDAGKKALDAERKARRDAEKALRDAEAKVREFEQRDLSESERTAQQVAELTKNLEIAQTEALRLRIASETGLDPDLHEFLDGITDEDQMRAKAKKLQAATAAPKKPDFGGGKRGDDPNSLASLDQRIADAVKAGDTRQSIALKRARQAMVNAAR